MVTRGRTVQSMTQRRDATVDIDVRRLSSVGDDGFGGGGGDSMFGGGPYRIPEEVELIPGAAALDGRVVDSLAGEMGGKRDGREVDLVADEMGGNRETLECAASIPFLPVSGRTDEAALISRWIGSN
mmetsp:Transcript_7844/g.15867  ORF Transcript_7844/g.15867 Transcript_7844/m.15867 type:complete len:127 (+) Transcript_7844:1451-1831(+)